MPRPQALALNVSPTAAGANAYGGSHVPDIVGNIRVDQAWGLFQIAGALHNVTASYNILGAGGVPTALSEISGHPEDKWGGAVTAALQIKNIPTGPGDDIKFDATYAKGMTKAVISTIRYIAKLRDVRWNQPPRCISERWLWPNV